MSGHNHTKWSYQDRKVSDFERDSSGCRHRFAKNRDGFYCVYCGETIYSAPTRNIIKEARLKANENLEVSVIEETPKVSNIKVRMRLTR